MNYQAIYERVIERAQRRVYAEGVYTERHHILPRCLGGSNDKSNLVRLLPDEHIFAHRLLCRMYPKEQRLSYAVVMTAVGRWGRESRKVYAMDRKRVIEESRRREHERWTPELRKQWSKQHTPEQRENMLRANGSYWSSLTQADKDAIGARRKGRKHSPETIEKLRQTGKERRSSLELLKCEIPLERPLLTY